jgi:hypothetical protein
MTTWTLIDSKDAPASNVFDFNALTLTGYEVLHVVCSGITVTTDGTDLLLTFYVGGVEIVTGYRWGMGATFSGGGVVINDGDASDPSIFLNSNDSGYDTGNAAGEAFDAVITVDNPTSTAFYKRAHFESVGTTTTGAVVATDGIGIMENAGAITGLKISGSSSLTAGKVRILGLA